MTLAPEPTPMREDVRQAVSAAIIKERDKPLQGPEHGAWDRGRRAGLSEAARIARRVEAERLAQTTRPGTADEHSRFWLIIREPGMIPDRKGPFKITDTAKVLREFMTANPNAFIDYLTVTSDGEPYVDHGPQVLQMTDGRSMATARKHNERVKAEAITAMRDGVDGGMVEVPREVVAFLKGEGPLDGQWFGDPKPVGEPGNFWWRKHLPNLAALSRKGEVTG
ncbi:hypothetical protein [Tardiphaga sp.]|uniref:hypothetical protein n=1 Tax=Tardiphaga sp. TaxID=1926292 RepID=UPI00352ADAFD